MSEVEKNQKKQKSFLARWRQLAINWEVESMEWIQRF